MDGSPQVLILGVGNILFKDEGIGVRAIERLKENGGLPSSVRLMDGGTMGMRLMDDMMSCDRLIVLDAVLGGGQPGSVYRLRGDGLRKSLSFKDSMHQIDLVDTLTFCELSGYKPDTVVIGMEPGDFNTMEIGLTDRCEQALPDLCEAVFVELGLSDRRIQIDEDI